ncbi:MAG: hypothetical protein ACK5JU_11690 [Bacteroidales bacterium]
MQLRRTVRKIFLSLIKSGMWNDYELPEEVVTFPTNWAQIYRLAKEQGVASLIWEATLRMPEQYQPSSKVKAYWQNHLNQNNKKKDHAHKDHIPARTKEDPLAFFNYIFYSLFASRVELGLICEWIAFLNENQKTYSTKPEYIATHQVLGFIAVKRLGLPQEKMPLYSDKRIRQADKLLDLIFSDYCVFQRTIGEDEASPSFYIFKRFLSIFRILPKDSLRFIYSYYTNPTVRKEVNDVFYNERTKEYATY